MVTKLNEQRQWLMAYYVLVCPDLFSVLALQQALTVYKKHVSRTVWKKNAV